MPVSNDTQKRILDLAEGCVDPENGMEKHFLRALKGEVRACTPEEKEWVAYYHAQLDAPPGENEVQDLDHRQQDEQVQTSKLCVDCSVVIPPERLSVAPNTLRCTKCQGKLEKSNPNAFARPRMRTNEGIAGTREDHYRMRGEVFGGIRSRNHEL